jgi:NADH-quinone oxidoreductase subunit F
VNAPDATNPSLDLSFVDQVVEAQGRRAEAVIPILQAIQRHWRYLPQEALERVCALTEITPATIIGVSTFYTQFRHRPVGRHIINVCHGTACHVKGAGMIQEALARRLRLAEGEDTDAEGLFTVEKVACLGCCTLAPVVQIDGVTYGRLTSATVPEAIEDFLRRQSAPARAVRRPVVFDGQSVGEIRIGLGSCCVAQGSGRVHDAIDRVLTETQAAAVVKRVGCVGMCHQTPLVEVISVAGASKLYAKVTPESVAPVVLKHFRPGGSRGGWGIGPSVGSTGC